jgi:hypothetical protein
MTEEQSFDRQSLLEEYRQLKSEIGEWSRVRNQFIGMSLTATAALVGLGLQWKNPFVFLATLLVQLPTMAICMAERGSIVTVAGYIQVMIETKAPELNWETMISVRLSRTKWNWIRTLVVGVGGFVTLPPLLSLGLAAVYWPWVRTAAGLLKWQSPMNWIYFVIASIVVVSIVKFFRASFRESADRKESLEQWRALATEMQLRQAASR